MVFLKTWESLKEKDVEEQVRNFEKTVDEVLKFKEKEIMTV